MSSTKEIKLVYSSQDIPKLNSPILVCGFPGSGYVGKLAIDHLIQELPARHLVDIYSSSFPPQVMIRADGTAELMKNSIFWWQAGNTKGDSGTTDLLLLTGDSQPSNPDSEYALAEEVLNIAGQFGTERVFTLAAYITGVFVDNPRVFGTATDPEMVKEFATHNISVMDSGSITGMNGLVIGIAKLQNMKGMCLLGETSGYVVDAKAAKVVLETLLEMTGIKVDMTNLEKRAKDTEVLIRTIEQQMLGGRTSGTPLEGPQQKPRDPIGYIS
ncbi:MAG TPA: proteasome assembly chaperone family protein [Nitrososphaera sp.]|nr:proteasome assembly chaperone family protein [Nitrososphaera sp.]